MLRLFPRIKYKKILEEVSDSELSQEETEQLLRYLKIFISNDFRRHWEVNEYISENDIWDKFSELRSLNDHGYPTKIKGITPKYFAIVCRALNIGGDNGAPLQDYEKY